MFLHYVSLFFKVLLAVLMLFLNAFGTYFVSSFLMPTVDGIELWLLPAFALLLSVFSYFWGYRMKQKYAKIKLFLWFFSVFSSVFVSLYLLGTPRTLPVYDAVSAVVLIISSLVIFAFSAVGYFMKHQTD